MNFCQKHEPFLKSCQRFAYRQRKLVKYDCKCAIKSDSTNAAFKYCQQLERSQNRIMENEESSFLSFLRNNNFFLDDETIFVNNEPTENSFNERDLNLVESELNEEYQEVKHSKTRRLVRNF